jgi:hypothetical protein
MGIKTLRTADDNIKEEEKKREREQGEDYVI